MQNNNHRSILDFFENTDNMDTLDEALQAILASKFQWFWRYGDDTQPLRRAFESRVRSMSQIPERLPVMIERYDAMCRDVLASLDGVFSWDELAVLLNAHPTNYVELSAAIGLADWALDPSGETPLEEDPGLPLARKLANLTVAQRIALCDVLERAYTRVNGSFHPDSLDFFGLRLAETATVSA